MNYLRINQRRVKEIELPRWVNYFLQIPLVSLTYKKKPSLIKTMAFFISNKSLK